MAKFLNSYASGASDKPMLGSTIGKVFDDAVDEYPDHEALISLHQQIRYSYLELKTRVDQCARAFLGLGVNKGDRIGIWSPNNAEWLITQLASAKIGALLVTINPSYRVHELEYVLKQSGCRVLVQVQSFKTSRYEDMICELCPGLLDREPGHLKSAQLPLLETVIAIDHKSAKGIFAWQQFLALADEVSDDDLNAIQAELEFDDAINIQYTSGTTGFPKGATLSHHNILNNGYFVAEIMNFTDQDRLVVPVPLYHCFGMVMANLGCITHGATLIYASDGFEPEAVLKAVQEERATALFGVPTMFIAELALDNFADFDVSSLRTGIMAGAPCPVDTMNKVIELMHMSEVEIAYGMTETSPVSFQTRVDAPLEKRVSTVGRVHPHVEVKIISPETGKICKTGETGELCTRGYSVMLGYWNNDEATADAIDDTAWLHTGDLAVMDDEGYVNIVGRIKDMIVRGGENVYPREVEEYLMTHPAVQDVQVTGVPDERFGEAIIAWVSLLDGQDTVTDEDLKAFCKDKIAHYKVPRYIKFVDEFPMTITGKVQKFKMRQISCEELGLVEQHTA
jgi:fatty-acyl-CoA synthase